MGEILRLLKVSKIMGESMELNYILASVIHYVSHITELSHQFIIVKI